MTRIDIILQQSQSRQRRQRAPWLPSWRRHLLVLAVILLWTARTSVGNVEHACEEDGTALRPSTPTSVSDDSVVEVSDIQESGADGQCDVIPSEENSMLPDDIAAAAEGDGEDDINEDATDSIVPPLHVIQESSDLQALFSPANRRDLWVTLVFETPEKCPHSVDAMNNFLQVRELYSEAMNEATEDSLSISVGFATLLVQPSTMNIVKDFKLKLTPSTVLFQTPRGTDSVWVVDYKGSMTDADSWWQGLRHYASRLGHATIEKRHRHLPQLKRRSTTREYPLLEHTATASSPNASKTVEWVNLSFLSYWNIPVESMEELNDIIASTVPSFHAPAPLELPVDPLLSETEAAWIRFLMEEEGDDALEEVGEEQDHSESSRTVPLWVSCRCQNASPALEEAWDAQAAALGAHHQLVFCQLEDCDSSSQAFNDTIFLYKYETILGELELQSSWVPAKDHSLRLELEAYLVQRAEEPEEENATTTTFRTADLASEISLEINKVMLALLLPPVMWLDRQATAPMGMAGQFPTHATLVIEYPSYSMEPSRFFDARQDQTKQVIRDFRKACSDFRTRQQEQYTGELPINPSPLVCWVVPSTETRILTTFGIDIWSSLDEELVRHIQQQEPAASDESATDEKGTATEAVLPVIFVTHRVLGAKGGRRLERFYLDPPLDSTTIQGFLERLWSTLTGNNEAGTTPPPLQPYVQSRYPAPDASGPIPRPVRNSHWVSEWTAYHTLNSSQWWLTDDEDEEEDEAQDGDATGSGEDRGRHALLLTYTPTCGHCKRLKVIWNSLSDLIHALHWDSWLEVARLDVSTEEFSGIVGADMVPSVYYYHHSVALGNNDPSGNGWRPPLWYNRQEAGGVSDPLEFLDWLLDVGTALGGDRTPWNPEDLLSLLDDTHPGLVEAATN